MYIHASTGNTRITSRTFLSLLLAALFFILFLNSFLDVVHAQAPCHLVTSGTTLPQGFGAPWNTQTATNELLISVACTDTSATVTLGTGNNLEYIYTSGYEYKNNAWHPLALEGTNTQGSWHTGRATAVLQKTQAELAQNNFIVGYICIWDGTSWKCGCKDRACSQSYWQLQVFKLEVSGGSGGTTGSGTTGGSSSFPAINACSGAKSLNATASNFSSTLGGAGNCATITLSPGTYPDTTIKSRQGITLRCSASGVVNQRGNASGCKLKRLTLEQSDNIVIDAINFAGGELSMTTNAKNILIKNSYFGEPSGISGITTFPARNIQNLQIINNTFYNAKHDGALTQPIEAHQGWSMDYGMKLAHVGDVLISGNQFLGRHNHSISLKRQIVYAEILNNRFVHCGGICIELGQEQSYIENGKIVNWTVREALIRKNSFEDIDKHGIVARDIAKVVIEENTFKNASNHAIMYWPLWRKAGVCNMGVCNSYNLLSTPNGEPITTSVKNNTFTGSNGVFFEGRGKSSDTVTFSGNSGNFTCRRISMDGETANVHGNEQTTAPPRVVGISC